MTGTSLNGWPAIQDGADPRLATGIVPGTNRHVTLARVALPLFLHYIAAWDAELPRLSVAKPERPCDGWEYRDARTGGGLSNHASGTAVDLAYDLLPATHELNMTAEEVGKLRAILAQYATADGHHVLAWGGRWSPSYNDSMHTELSQAWDSANGAIRNTTPHDVLEVTTRLGIRADGTTATPPTPQHQEADMFIVTGTHGAYVTDGVHKRRIPSPEELHAWQAAGVKTVPLTPAQVDAIPDA